MAGLSFPLKFERVGEINNGIGYESLDNDTALHLSQMQNPNISESISVIHRLLTSGNEETTTYIDTQYNYFKQ